MHKIVISMILILGFVLQGYANPVIPKGDFSKKLEKAAGKQGQFVVGKDNFPKSYFLVHQNLPFFAGLTLHHPKSSTLGLSKKQVKAIVEIKKRTVPLVIKKAQDIKLLELKLAKNIVIDSNTPKSQYEIVETIGKLRIELTKAHLKCISEVRTILNDEQYKKLLSYASNMTYNKKSNKFKIDELVILPHPGKLIKSGKIKATKDQKEKITMEVKSIYAPIFQSKIRKAFDLEKKVQKMVSEGNNKEDMKELLNQISKLKREAIDSRIDALNHVKEILTPEQWKKLNKLSYR